MLDPLLDILWYFLPDRLLPDNGGPAARNESRWPTWVVAVLVMVLLAALAAVIWLVFF